MDRCRKYGGCAIWIFLLFASPASYSETERTQQFDDLYQSFLEEREIPDTDSEALAFLDLLNQKRPENDSARKIKADVVDCFFAYPDDFAAQRAAGQLVYQRALAAGMSREAGLARRCEASALEMIEGSESAFPLYREAVELTERSGDRFATAVARIWLSSALGMLDMPGDSIAELLLAQQEFEAMGRKDRAQIVDIDIAALYRRIGRLDRAEKLLDSLLETLDVNPELSFADKVIVLYQLSMILSEQGRHQEALVPLEDADALLDGHESLFLQMALKTARARAFNGLGNYEEALRYVDLALQMHADVGSGVVSNLLLKQAEALIGLGKVDDALATLDSISDASDLIESRALGLRWLVIRAAAKSEIGHFESAYRLLDQARRLDRVIQVENNAQQLLALEGNLEARERQQALERAEDAARLKQSEIANLKRLQRWKNLAVLALIMAIAILLLWMRQQRGQRKQLTELALKDSLTGLTNRRGFIEQAACMARVRESDKPGPALLAMDLDFFKGINDNYGHPAGDQVLVAVAAVLRSAARGNDLIGRLGGEEFSLLLPSASRDEAFNVAERLRKQLESTDLGRIIPGRKLTCSIGVALADEEGIESFGDLQLRADRRLYQAKRKGRNRVEISDEVDGVTYQNTESNHGMD